MKYSPYLTQAEINYIVNCMKKKLPNRMAGNIIGILNDSPKALNEFDE